MRKFNLDFFINKTGIYDFHFPGFIFSPINQSEAILVDKENNNHESNWYINSDGFLVILFNQKKLIYLQDESLDNDAYVVTQLIETDSGKYKKGKKIIIIKEDRDVIDFTMDDVKNFRKKTTLSFSNLSLNQKLLFLPMVFIYFISLLIIIELVPIINLNMTVTFILSMIIYFLTYRYNLKIIDKIKI